MPDSQAVAADELKALLGRYPETQVMEVMVPDLNGILRGKRIGPKDFSKVFDEGINYWASAVIMDAKGSVFESIGYGTEDGDPDITGCPVPGTLAPVPWASLPSAQVLLTLTGLDGQAHFLDPRNVLRTAAQPLLDMGLRPVIATELEFYLLEHDGKEFRPLVDRLPGSQLRQEGEQFGNLDDLAHIDPFLTDLANACREQGIPAGAALSEYAAGQFEVNLEHVADPTLACDHALLLKRAVKAIARQHDMAASFMAKPFSDSAGCGLHVHLSLLDADGKNIFQGSCKDGDFSDALRYAAGGMAALAEESMSIFSPNANSYRRYVPYAYAPTTPNWGENHRHLAFRIPLSSEENTRIEHRIAGADANPFLVVAAILAGIHHGLTHEIDPGPIIRAGDDVEDEVTLPTRWEPAMSAFEAGKILPAYLGEEYHRVYGMCRREESDRFHAEISNRDFEWYLRAV